MGTPAYVYVRISSDREGAGLGVARQETDCRQLADRLGWTVTHVYVDNDISAYSGKPRPGYQTMLQALERGEAKGLLAWHTDRLHRAPRELETFIDVIETTGVEVQTVKAGNLDLSTPSGRMVARMLGAQARYEVEHMAERQRARRVEKVKAGEFTGGPRPFGYEADGVTVREAEAAELRWAAGRLLEGVSLNSVARDFNSRGVTTSTGGVWTGTEVRRVLRRPRNAGLVQHRGQVVGGAVWPAVLDEETWRGVCALLSDPSRKTSTGTGRVRVGAGLYLCGPCGSPVRTSVSSRQTGRKLYVCRESKCVARDADATDALVFEVVLRRLERPDAAFLAVPETVDVSGLRAEAAGLRGRLDELARLFADGVIDGVQLGEASTTLRGRLGRVESELGRAEMVSPLARFVGADVRQVWDGLDVDARCRVVGALVEVRLLRSPRGRPAGWRPGEPYFRPDTVKVRLLT